MKFHQFPKGKLCFSRSPYGERGLKYIFGGDTVTEKLSLPVWGAWIEIHQDTEYLNTLYRRSPYGERGLKSTISLGYSLADVGRSPYGERGLK